MTRIEALGSTFVLPMLWTGVTLACYFSGLCMRHVASGHALVNPVLIAILLMLAILFISGTPYAEYFHATWLLTVLLAPATVALGAPLAKYLRQIKDDLWGVTLGLVAGSLASMLSGVGLVYLFGGSKSVAMSMLPKGATTPIAILVSEQVGGQPGLTASLAIVGGIIAAVTLRLVLAKLHVTHTHAVGLAAGTAGSGIGAAHVAVLGDGPAAFAAIGIGLNGLVTALLAPLVATLWR